MNILRKITDFCFDRWWNPILLCVFSFILIVIAWACKSNLLAYVAYPLFFLSLFLILVSVYYQFKHKRKAAGIASILAFIGATGAFLVIGVIAIAVEMIDGDRWADDIKIPPNIDLHVPKAERDDYTLDSINKITTIKPDFEIYNDFQPGIYQYHLWIDNLEAGTVYLKAYEVTQNYRLSGDGIKRESSVHVYNPSDIILPVKPTGNFTIYEGDWGKFYAARFEVWFIPDGNGQQERKLMEKIYKVEGWQH